MELSRRDALKVAAAGMTLLSASSATAQRPDARSEVALPQDPIPIRELKGKTISLAARPNIKAEGIHKALDEIFRMSGCPSCGLNGFDIRLKGVLDQDIRQRFTQVEKIEGISGIEVNER